MLNNNDNNNNKKETKSDYKEPITYLGYFAFKLKTCIFA